MPQKTRNSLSLLQKLFGDLIRFLLHLLTDFKVEGTTRIPEHGAVMLVANHLHWLDGPVIFTVLPRKITVFAAEKFENRFSLPGFFLRRFTNPIWVARGQVDRRALRGALDALERGEMLAISPEGTRSKTGGLQEARDGSALLAARSGALLLPVVAWGHEKALQQLLRLQRPRIRVVVGEPFRLPPETADARSSDLRVHTDQIMQTLAAMLPEAYRGFYR